MPPRLTESQSPEAGRGADKRRRVVEVAMRHFATDGFDGARVEDIAREAGVAKGAVFAYFETKAGLFLAAYKAATQSFHAYLDAPAGVLDAGFFATLSYWLAHTTQLIQESWVPYRVSLLGNYCSDLRTRRDITQYLAREDPYGTRAFVTFGIERGEVRSDVDPKVIVSLFNWSVDACQDAIVAEELDPGLFSVRAPARDATDEYVRQFVELLRSAIGRP